LEQNSLEENSHTTSIKSTNSPYPQNSKENKKSLARTHADSKVFDFKEHE